MRGQYELNFQRARSNLLMMAVLTLVNVILTLANASISFTFSAFFPLLATVYGQAYQKMVGDSTFMIVALILAGVSIGLYILCWWLSKKHPGAMIAALVLFSLDCLILIPYMLWSGEIVSYLIDIVFHAWVMYYLVLGVVAFAKLRKMPPEETYAPYADDNTEMPQPYTPPHPVESTVEPTDEMPTEAPAEPVSAEPAPIAPNVPEVPPVTAEPAISTTPTDEGRLPEDFPSQPL